MTTNIKTQVGKRIKEFRKKKGYTQEQLAETVGIDYKYLQRIEGKNPPNITLQTVEKFATALRIKPYKLFS